jgi:hypothetical protein
MPFVITKASRPVKGNLDWDKVMLRITRYAERTIRRNNAVWKRHFASRKARKTEGGSN